MMTVALLHVTADDGKGEKDNEKENEGCSHLRV